MIFLTPWALAIGAVAAAGAVVLHLVAVQRPAAYLLPTTRFIPAQRTLVSRVATRPRDLLLLALRVLLLLSAGAAFARPVLTPARGAIAHIVLLDRARAVGNAADAVARARTLVADGALITVIAFDSVPTVLVRPAWDSLAGAPRSEVPGSLTAALLAARRAGAILAERADSVRLYVVSPFAAGEFDAASDRARAAWPGAVVIERVALRSDAATTWRVEPALSAADPLGPAVAAISFRTSERSERVSRSAVRVPREQPQCTHGGSRQSVRACGMTTRLVRGAPTAADSAFARDGGTVVRWDTSAAPRVGAAGLAAGDDVVVAALGRLPMSPTGRVIARWEDGMRAAVEHTVGTGCMRDVGIVLPAAGDIALHPPFQRIARGLLAPCGLIVGEIMADSTAVARLAGTVRTAARADDLRSDVDRLSPLACWLLALAILLAIAEVIVRTQPAPEIA